LKLRHSNCYDLYPLYRRGATESLARVAGFPSAGLTSAQHNLFSVRRVRLAGQVIGVLIGCSLGLLNLLFIDTERSSTLKLRNIQDEHECQFEIEASNEVRPNASTFVVRGPDVDGLLASLTLALAENGCSLVELNAHNSESRDGKNTISGSNYNEDTSSYHHVEDVFIVVDQETRRPLTTERLEHIAKVLLDACKGGGVAVEHSLRLQIKELEARNDALMYRINKLERNLLQRRISIQK